MCGIAGFYNWKITSEDQVKVIRSLYHRGPDDQGTYQKGHVTLLHTRLSIIELSTLAAQPYRYKNLVLVFNGEIYNYVEIRLKLISFGYSFESNSDTEVLIKAFHFWREKAVDHFIGMFAFCVYDEELDCIYLFRDRVGVKPLYYSFTNDALAFASELKALSCIINNKTIDEEALKSYFRFGFIQNAHSIYKSIFKLDPGYYITLSKSQIKKVKYWSPSLQPDTNKNESQWIEELESLLISSFSYRMVADVPVGIFLSGGIDSSLLAAILKRHYGSINSFTIGFKEGAFDESPYAREAASYLKIEHHEKQLELIEAKAWLENFYKIYDEPFADTSGIPVACVTKLAKDAGMKVVLSADGGDELFGGYNHYTKAYTLYQRIQRLPYSSRKALVALTRKYIGKTFRESIFNFNFEHRLFAVEELLLEQNLQKFFEAYVANQSLPEIEELLLNFTSAEFTLSRDEDKSQQAMLMWDFANYLPDDLLVKVDRATMYQSLECREPFLDHRLVELSWRMPIQFKIKNGEGKFPLRKILANYIPRDLFQRKKQGFSIPIFKWFKDDLDKYFADFFSDQSLDGINFLNKEAVKREYKKYIYYKRKNKDYNIEKMWRLLSLLMWWRSTNES